MGDNGKGWPQEHKDELIRLLTVEGVSLSVAAEMMNDKFQPKRPFTRNSCCGMGYRMGVSSGLKCPERPRKPAAERKPRKPRPKPAPQPLSADRPRAAVSLPPHFPPLRCADVEPRNITLFELTNETCRYPNGDRAPFLFCGNPVWTGCVYCGSHAMICFQERT